jgi:phenylpropionate dioxygenase-like ring-hydroxylating dioxygenase large terminal subunit
MSRRGLASDRPDPNAKGVYGKKLSYISGTGQSHVTFGGTRTMDAHAATCRKPWQGLFERLITEWDVRQSPEWDCAETRLPSAVYTDPQRYQAELNILFRAMPLCLGHEDQLDTSGAVLAREVAGLPLLVTRDSSGAVRVFLNACRHRGARLMPGEETVCRRSSLSCMYHGWTYGLDGRLLSVPRREAFPTLDVAEHGLRQLPSTVRHGLVWATLNPTSTARPDIAAYLGGLDEDLAILGLGRHRFFRQNAVVRKTNWKLIIDAFIEFYHIKRLHAATVGQYFADTKAAADWVGPHQRLLVARDTFSEVLQLPQEQWSPQLHGTLVHFIFPNSVFVHHPDYISHMGIFPAGIDRSLFVHTVLTPEAPADEKARAHWDRSFELIDGKVFNDEDLFICEQIQLGLAAAANGEFVLGRFENNVRRFHKTIATSLDANDVSASHFAD